MPSKTLNPGNYLNHIVSVRVRVEGVGNLEVYIASLNNVTELQLSSIAMELLPEKIPTVLANFKRQKIQIHIQTVEMDEVFQVGDITPFIKPTAVSYPL